MRENKDPKSQAKKFGKTMFYAFLIFGGLLIWKGKALGYYSFGLSFLFLLFSWLAPTILIPIERGWMKVGYALGWVNTRILLTILFFVILTPIRFFLWLLRKDLLDQKIDRSKSSYWILREFGVIDPKRYERLY